MATNCWCHPNFEKQENFLRYGQSLLAAFVNNIYNQGILKLGDTRVKLLPKGKFEWIELVKNPWHHSSAHQRGDAEKVFLLLKVGMTPTVGSHHHWPFFCNSLVVLSLYQTVYLVASQSLVMNVNFPISNTVCTPILLHV